MSAALLFLISREIMCAKGVSIIWRFLLLYYGTDSKNSSSIIHKHDRTVASGRRRKGGKR